MPPAWYRLLFIALFTQLAGGSHCLPFAGEEEVGCRILGADGHAAQLRGGRATAAAQSRLHRRSDARAGHGR